MATQPHPALLSQPSAGCVGVSILSVGCVHWRTAWCLHQTSSWESERCEVWKTGTEEELLRSREEEDE